MKRPLASLQFTVCESKVIKVIVTSTMIKLGQCNPHPPPPQARLKRGEKKMRIASPDSVRGCNHGDTGAWFAFSMGWYLCCVGTSHGATPDYLDMFLPPFVVCGLQCHVMICPPVSSPDPICLSASVVFGICSSQSTF